MQSVLITGANGQLGRALRKSLNRVSGLKCVFTDIDNLDICKKTQIEDFITQQHVGYIVNCAAYTAVDKAEDEQALCMRINRDAVKNIGEVAFSGKIKVVHISTDYVFDGSATRPYREDDATNPTSFYGKSKLAGEHSLMSANPDSVIIRTAWLYSETGHNFLKTMLRLGVERDSIDVVGDQSGTPTYAGDLAFAITDILKASFFTPGIYHYTNNGICTWYDFAVKIFEEANIKCHVNKLAAREYPTRAMRPAYSVLDKTKIREIYNVQLPAWQEGLKKCLHNMNGINN